jgi:hypothetical protein
MGRSDAEPESFVKIVLVIWAVLLIPWLPFAALSGLAFDGGPTLAAYVIVWALLTYPVSLLIAWLLRKKAPFLVFLPCVNVILFCLSGLLT